MPNVRLTGLGLAALLTACHVPVGLVGPTAVLPMAAQPVAATVPTAGGTTVPGPWQPASGDWQSSAEALAPRMVYPKVDEANRPYQLLYATYTDGPLVAFRYFVLYYDEDLQSKVEDDAYDAFRRLYYGAVTDIEPIEVFADATTQAFAGVAFKTAHGQPYYKVIVEENTWLTYRPGDLTATDRVGDHPRIADSTWNHLHDLPSVLQGLPYAPDTDAPPLPVRALTSADEQTLRFDRRGLVSDPKGDVTKLVTGRSDG